VKERIPDDFYDRIEPRLYRMIGQELRLAYRVLDIGCGGCELCDFLVQTYSQQVIGVDVSSEEFHMPENHWHDETGRFRKGKMQVAQTQAGDAGKGFPRTAKKKGLGINASCDSICGKT
jgi:2-polyprenyl-3-methyl-5-hydroxy-6-metoxy-1,4-benzoquinol methylase